MQYNKLIRKSTNIEIAMYKPSLVFAIINEWLQMWHCLCKDEDDLCWKRSISGKNDFNWKNVWTQRNKLSECSRNKYLSFHFWAFHILLFILEILYIISVSFIRQDFIFNIISSRLCLIYLSFETDEGNSVFNTCSGN